MPFHKGCKKSPLSGRKPGQQNKGTIAFKSALLNVFHEIGGENKLAKWAMENPDEFYKLCGRLIPTELTGSGESGIIEIVHRIKQSELDK